MLISGSQKRTPTQQSYKVQDEFLSVLHRAKPNNTSANLSALKSSESVHKIRHHIMNSLGNGSQAHGKLKLNIEVDNSAAHQLNLPPLTHCKSTPVSALADTSAQMCVADWQVGQRLGLKRKDLVVPALSISVADNYNLELIGAHFLRLSTPTGESTQQLVYFATEVGEFYLSKGALIDLKIISHDFPRVGACSSNFNMMQSHADVQGHTADYHELNEVQNEFTSVVHKVNPAPQDYLQHQGASPPFYIPL